MARARDDDDPRPARRARPVRKDDYEVVDDDYEVVEERPRRRRREEDYDDEDDRPRRRRRSDEGDATGGIIPYKNGKALAAYYCGVFGLIPGVGLILGPIALILGILGLMHVKTYPKSKGTGHAIAGIILGIVAVPWSIAFPFLLGLV